MSDPYRSAPEGFKPEEPAEVEELSIFAELDDMLATHRSAGRMPTEIRLSAPSMRRFYRETAKLARYATHMGKSTPDSFMTYRGARVAIVPNITIVTEPPC